jgi:hypothetical protein
MNDWQPARLKRTPGRGDLPVFLQIKKPPILNVDRRLEFKLCQLSWRPLMSPRQRLVYIDAIGIILLINIP